MLKAFCCACHSATPLVRQLFQRMEVPNWMSVPVHMGKDQALTVLGYFPPQYKALLSFRALEDHISSATSFAIIVGWNDEEFYWSDIYHNDAADVVQAEAIAKRFA